MWSNRWVKVGAIALGILVVNGASRLVTRLVDGKTSTNPTSVDYTPAAGNGTADKITSVAGVLAVVLLVGIVTAVWSVRQPFLRVFSDIFVAVLAGTALALLIGPFIGGAKPFGEGLGSFVGEFLQFLLLGAVGLFLGFVTMVALGKDWRTRGLQAYAERYGKRPHRAMR
jgi:hypothetical protein